MQIQTTGGGPQIHDTTLYARGLVTPDKLKNLLTHPAIKTVDLRHCYTPEGVPYCYGKSLEGFSTRSLMSDKTIKSLQQILFNDLHICAPEGTHCDQVWTALNQRLPAKEYKRYSLDTLLKKVRSETEPPQKTVNLKELPQKTVNLLDYIHNFDSIMKRYSCADSMPSYVFDVLGKRTLGSLSSLHLLDLDPLKVLYLFFHANTLKSLTSLSLRNCERLPYASVDTLAQLARTLKLTSLSLHRYPDLRTLPGSLPASLVTLRLLQCPNLDLNEALKTLSTSECANSLEILDLSLLTEEPLKELRSDPIKILGSYPKLQQLKLCGRTLNHFIWDDPNHDTAPIGTVNWKQLATACPHLQLLDIRNTDITNESDITSIAEAFPNTTILWN